MVDLKKLKAACQVAIGKILVRPMDYGVAERLVYHFDNLDLLSSQRALEVIQSFTADPRYAFAMRTWFLEHTTEDVVDLLKRVMKGIE